MENQELFKKIEDLFTNQKSSKFLTHLMHSYLPTSKVNVVLDKPSSKHQHKCAITGVKLVSYNEAATIFQNQMNDLEAFKQSLIIKLDSDGNTITGESPFKEKLNGRILGYTGEETNTYLCKEAIEALLNWTMSKMLKGDKKINFIVKKLNLNNNSPKSSKPKTSKPKSYNKIPKQPIKSSSTTLGDFQALKDLKAKMEK